MAKFLKIIDLKGNVSYVPSNTKTIDNYTRIASVYKSTSAEFQFSEIEAEESDITDPKKNTGIDDKVKNLFNPELAAKDKKIQELEALLAKQESDLEVALQPENDKIEAEIKKSKGK
jgi:hypothetical protein